MAWASKELTDNKRWWHFSFYHTNGANGKISESIIPGTDFAARVFELAELRLKFSIAFVSIEYLKVYLSSVKGSAYNFVLVSRLMSGSTDYRFNPANSIPMRFLSDDHLVLEFSNVSGTNVIGLEVQGWAAVG